MMVALGLSESSARVNFANCRITLQPANASDIQLTFPVEVNTERIRAGVVREALWERQFNLHPDGDNFYNASLRWPHEKQPSKAPVAWHEQVSDFRCIATDLGQRDAGAFARLSVRSGGSFGKRPWRFIGETGGKQWRAALERSGLFRLPGEDALVWREKSKLDGRDSEDSAKPFDFRQELWGERGRPAREWETAETVELMRLLEAPPADEHFSLLPADWRTSLSFPEQNGKLMVAARRYQSRIARLHRLCWFLKGDDKQQKAGWDEIGDCEDTRLVRPELKLLAEKRDPRVKDALESQLRERLELAPKVLVHIANRILPLRGRSWHWERHPAGTEDNTLHQLTQNGESRDSKEKPNLDCQLAEAQKELERDWKEKARLQPCPKRTLLVSISGGPVFVPVVDGVEGSGLVPAIVQADINAAINLALRATADPRLWTIHPRLRSQREGGDKPAKGKRGKSAEAAATPLHEAQLLTREKRKFGETGKPLVIHRGPGAKPDSTRQPNFFADFAGLEALAERLGARNPRDHGWLQKEWTSAEISGESSAPPLVHGKSFWGCVKAAQWERIGAINAARRASWRAKLDLLPG